MTDIDTQIEERIKTFMDDNLHVVLEDEGDQSVIPTEQFAQDLAKAIKTLLDTAVQEARIDENQRWANGYMEAFREYPELDNPEDLMAAKQDFEDRIKELKSTSKEDK